VKPVRLELRGFTSFREPTTVDFTGRRLFVITGPTGAGKSSLLDAMMWALYGQAPRVGRAMKDFLSQGEREMSVLLEFTVRGQSYRVARRHPAANSTRLERRVVDQWVPMADRAPEVTRQVEAILGMDFATFTRAIVLPQGQFDSFLRGDTKDRRNILSQLIGLGVYEEAARIARSRATASKAQAETLRTQLEQLQFATPEVITALNQQLTTLRAEEQQLATQRTALMELRELATDERDLRQAAEQARIAAAEAATTIETSRTAVSSARIAATTASEQVATLQREQAALAYDRQAHDQLKSQVAVLDQRDEAQLALTEAVAEIERTTQALAAATTEQEQAAAARDSAAAGATTASEAASQAAQSLALIAGVAAATRAMLEGQLREAEEQQQVSTAAARDLEQQARDLDVLQKDVLAAVDESNRATAAFDRASAATHEAESSAKATAAARDEATRAVEIARASLDRARTQDAAAHIRATLKPGDACPVCGETITVIADHAAPDLEAAERALREAEALLSTATSEAERAAVTLASARTRAEEAATTVASLNARLDALQLQVEASGAAGENIATLVQDRIARARAENEQATAKATEVVTLRDSIQELRDVLARIPDAITPTEAATDARTTPAEVRAAIDSHRVAAEASAKATQAAENAIRGTTDAEREVANARQALERAQQSKTQAETRLARLGGAELDASALRTALAQADALLQWVDAVASSLQQAQTQHAAAQARLEAAEASLARDEQQHQRLIEAAASTLAAAEAARTRFEAAWRNTVPNAPGASMRALKEVMEVHEADRIRVATTIERAQGDLARAEEQRDQSARIRIEVQQHQATADLAGAVAQELRGDRFVAYLLHESMQLLAVDASERLTQFSNGRYELIANEDEFMVVDHLNGDEQRPVRTLSGGETFLASLALALALSEHLPEISGTGGAVSLDSLFLDEGFGALDAEALDLAVQGLETLAEGSRMIGVISHVEELSERFLDRIRVEKGINGSTVVA